MAITESNNIWVMSLRIFDGINTQIYTDRNTDLHRFLQKRFPVICINYSFNIKLGCRKIY